MIKALEEIKEEVGGNAKVTIADEEVEYEIYLTVDGDAYVDLINHPWYVW